MAASLRNLKILQIFAFGPIISFSDQEVIGLKILSLVVVFVPFYIDWDCCDGVAGFVTGCYRLWFTNVNPKLGLFLWQASPPVGWVKNYQKNYASLGKLLKLPEGLQLLGLMGARIKDPLKALDTILPWCTEDFRGPSIGAPWSRKARALLDAWSL